MCRFASCVKEDNNELSAYRSEKYLDKSTVAHRNICPQGAEQRGPSRFPVDCNKMLEKNNEDQCKKAEYTEKTNESSSGKDH